MLPLLTLALVNIVIDASVIVYTIAVAKRSLPVAIVMAMMLEALRKVDMLIVTDVRGSLPVLVSTLSSGIGALIGFGLGAWLDSRQKAKQATEEPTPPLPRNE